MARLTRKPLTPTPEEVAGNPRARSAKMRIAEKINPSNWEEAHVSKNRQKPEPRGKVREFPRQPHGN
jgi:hypothetical protein